MNGEPFKLKKLSIVIPVYYNAENLPYTIPRLLKLKEQIPNYDLELIFVDDGSKDDSLKILLDFKKKYPNNINVIKLTRNFGSMSAIQAGLSVSKGDCIGVIAADLQDPPELFLDMIKHWENGIKVVLATRKKRQDPLLSRMCAAIFYKIFRKYAISEYPKGGFDFFLIDKQVLVQLNKIHEKNSNIMNLLMWLGFDYVTIPYLRQKRKRGTSKWTLSKKIKLVFDSFIGFSYVPIKILPTLGIIFAIASFLYGGFTLYNWTVGNIPIQGWTTNIIIITFTAGIQMIMLGILGEYLWRTLDETRKRPSFVIDRDYNDEE